MDYVFEAVGLLGTCGCGFALGVMFMAFRLRHMFRGM